MSSGEVVLFANFSDEELLETGVGVDVGAGVDLCWSFWDDSDCCWIEEGMKFDFTVGT